MMRDEATPGGVSCGHQFTPPQSRGVSSARRSPRVLATPLMPTNCVHLDIRQGKTKCGKQVSVNNSDVYVCCHGNIVIHSTMFSECDTSDR